MRQAICKREASVTFPTEYLADKSKLAPEIRHLVDNRSDFSNEEYKEALDQYGSIRPIVDKQAARHSVIVTPGAIDKASLGLANMGSPVLNTLWTVSFSLMGCFLLQ
jgi:hypothetical protein